MEKQHMGYYGGQESHIVEDRCVEVLQAYIHCHQQASMHLSSQMEFPHGRSLALSARNNAAFVFGAKMNAGSITVLSPTKDGVVPIDPITSKFIIFSTSLELHTQPFIKTCSFFFPIHITE